MQSLLPFTCPCFVPLTRTGAPSFMDTDGGALALEVLPSKPKSGESIMIPNALFLAVFARWHRAKTLAFNLGNGAAHVVATADFERQLSQANNQN